ncbi:hypothetical protein [Leptolyngbya ohadii]|uniref:hypothetical protein n=1 Tax=Leptolyngbya ohadii TaxID=1962290 RepID=UPI000B598968|nr:hypothetical protein [Leptolyngbya ohadii]
MSQSDALHSIISPSSATTDSLSSGDQGLSITPADYQALLDELTQARDLDRERTTRIHHLEQALDQALVYLEEMKVQVQEQSLLETQLAATEEFSQVQQQAIARLKLQLAEQQQSLEAQVLETQQRDQAIQELLQAIEGMTRLQQQEVERLRLRLSQDQLENQNQRQRLAKQIQDLQNALDSRQQRMVELESETLAARSLSVTLQGQLEVAQQQIHELSAHLCQKQSSYSQLETQLKRMQASLVEQQQRIAHWQQVIYPAERSTETPTDISLESSPEYAPERQDKTTLERDLEAAHRQVENLEQQLVQYTIQQSRWQQQQQELEADRQQLQERLEMLEQRMAEMQEQILHQAQQGAEYETAVQYWKDHYNRGQGQIAQMKALIQQLLTHPAAAHSLPPELMQAFQSVMVHSVEPSASSVGSPRLPTIELPDFLVRRRAQTVKDPAKDAGTNPS